MSKRKTLRERAKAYSLLASKRAGVLADKAMALEVDAWLAGYRACQRDGRKRHE